MTREEFIELLEDRGYSYKIEGDKIVVTYKGLVTFDSLKILPPGVEFRNKGDVWLEGLVTLPHGVEFGNDGLVTFGSLKILPPGVEFRNVGNVNFYSLKTLPHGVEFRNKGDVWLGLVVGGWFGDWKGNIEGIGSKRLLNLMIKQGVFI